MSFEMDQVFQWLSAGGDGAMIALFVLMWRLDRRVIRLEILLNGKKKK